MPDPHAINEEDVADLRAQVEKQSKIQSALDPDMKIRQNYQRKNALEEESKTTGVQKCPNCKLDISKAEWKNHYKICVLDTKWKDNKQQRIDRAGGMN